MQPAITADRSSTSAPIFFKFPKHIGHMATIFSPGTCNSATLRLPTSVESFGDMDSAGPPQQLVNVPAFLMGAQATPKPANTFAGTSESSRYLP